MKPHLLVSICLASVRVLFAQDTAFTYQGRLNDNANPAGGVYDLRFALYDSTNLPGGLVAGPLTNAAVVINNGLFTVTLDFGTGVFTGPARWLDIAVRTNGGSAFTPLSPRQALTATPYAVTAGNVVSGGLAAGTYPSALTLNNPANSISGTFAGNGANVTGVNAANLNGLSSAGFWKTTGNTGANPANGAFIGTADYLPLEIRANGIRALRIEPGPTAAFSASLIGGSTYNMVSNGFYGAVIAGGGSSEAPNRVGATFASVLGGSGNTASGLYSTAAGQGTIASGLYSTALGRATIANNDDATAMGYGTLASGWDSVAMGSFTKAIGHYSIAMGGNTAASNSYATAMGSSTIANGAASTAMGSGTKANGSASTAMGFGTTASGLYSTALGRNTTAANDDATALGFGTTASGWDSIAMGTYSIASGHYSFAAGYYARATNQGSFVWSDSSAGTPFSSTANNEFAVRASGGVRMQTSYLHISGGGNEQAYIGGDGNGGDVEIGSRNAGIMNVGFWNAAAFSHMNLYALTFNPGSDRNIKQDFKPMDPKEILDKVVALPVTEWAYKADPQTRHLGPVAQDFQAAFGLGSSDKSIATVDADGVALAAIQGLNQKLSEELKRRDAENAELKLRLERLEQMLVRQAGGVR